MGLSDVNNDIKVLFFIVNSITGLLAGLLTFSLGVGLGVVDGLRNSAAVFGLIVVGLIILGVAALGYAGAIRQNRIMLFIYTGIMVLAVVLDIVGMVLVDLSGPNNKPYQVSVSYPSSSYRSSSYPSYSYPSYSASSLLSLASMISHLGLSVLAVVLALVLALRARRQTNQGMILSPPPATYNAVA